MNPTRRFVASATLVVAATSSGCGSRQKQNVNQPVPVAATSDSARRKPDVFLPLLDDSAQLPVYFPFQVEKPVAASPSNEAPAYPSELLATKPHGEVVVEFVVDTTGRVDMKSLTVLKSTHDLFTDAVRRALPQYRFFPAELAGRKVRQRVQMPFSFSAKSPT